MISTILDDWFFRSIPILKSHINGCHGNHAFSRSPNDLFLWTFLLQIKGAITNNMTPNRNCPDVQAKLNWMSGYKVDGILHTLKSYYVL